MTREKSKKIKLFVGISILAVVLIALAVVVTLSFLDAQVSEKLSVEEAQELVDQSLSKLAKRTAIGAVFVVERSTVTVKDVSFGTEKDMILTCEYQSVDILAAFRAKEKEIFERAYGIYKDKNEEKGRKISATELRLAMHDLLEEATNAAEPIFGEVTMTFYEVSEGEFELYRNDATIDACFGGLVSLSNYVDNIQEIEYEGETVDIKNSATLRTAIKDCYSLINYESTKPETGNAIVKLWRSLSYDFHRNFIEDNRWMYLVSGLGTTLSITALAGVLGMILGFAVAIVRCTKQMTGKLGFIDKICSVYLTVIRGTPVMVQLLIIYFVLLLPLEVPKFVSAVLCFGLNSGAYVAEIVRGGIMAIDKGQMEAGRSLGFGYAQSMIHFIMPQAFKAVLPSLANEFITLLKESSVAFYIGVADLTQGGLKIRSVTFSTFMPLIAVALIYLAIVMILTKLVSILERRLRKSER